MFRRAPKRLGEAQRHFRCDAGAAVENRRESLARNAQALRRLGHGQIERLKAVLPDRPGNPTGTDEAYAVLWSDITGELDRLSASCRMEDGAADTGLGDWIGISLRGESAELIWVGIAQSPLPALEWNKQ